MDVVVAADVVDVAAVVDVVVFAVVDVLVDIAAVASIGKRGVGIGVAARIRIIVKRGGNLPAEYGV